MARWKPTAVGILLMAMGVGYFGVGIYMFRAQIAIGIVPLVFVSAVVMIGGGVLLGVD